SKEEKQKKALTNCNRQRQRGRDERPQSFLHRFFERQIDFEPLCLPCDLCAPCGEDFDPLITFEPRDRREILLIKLMNPPRRFLPRRRNDPLRSRTEIAVWTKHTVILGIRRKLPARDPVRHLLHAQLCFLQLPVSPCRAHSRVVLEVIKDEAVGM